MSKKALTRLAACSKQSIARPKFYPCFYLRIPLPRQNWCGRRSIRGMAVDSVFNIIFKKIYSVRYRDVSGESRVNEARYYE